MHLLGAFKQTGRIRKSTRSHPAAVSASRVWS
jgi:hypothetical protein